MGSILREAQLLSKRSGKGFSVQELAEACGMGVSAVKEKLHAMFLENRLVCEKREGRTMDGRRCWTPVYRVVKKRK